MKVCPLTAPQVAKGHSGNKLCFGSLVFLGPKRSAVGRKLSPEAGFSHPVLTSTLLLFPHYDKHRLGCEQDQRSAKQVCRLAQPATLLAGSPSPGLVSFHKVPLSCSEVALTPLLCASFCEPTRRTRQAVPPGVHKENKN